MRPSGFQDRRAFTLIELIFALLIVGILASIALPRFSHTVEKSRITEAINILSTLRDAQELYRQEKGTYTAVRDDLDVTINTPAYFLMPTVDDVEPIASIRRNAGGYDYTLTIDGINGDDGTVKCAGVAPAGICAKLGCNGGAGDECN
ncbi:MAG: prepilin-type N-terminal cleavage/methylation domain-containing protein [Candidatus Omnitrophica bacterium]|nr:prepilin-type N-terminal cleavage/methylation domain-containing protein [Candidatus Omnitrophota bacterium]